MNDDGGREFEVGVELIARLRALEESLEHSVWALQVANQALRSSAGPEEIKNTKYLIKETLLKIKAATK